MRNKIARTIGGFLLLAISLTCAGRLQAQQPPSQPADQPSPAAPNPAEVPSPDAATITASGTLHTATGVPLPGATVRLVHTPSGRAWVSWTDEKGHFSLPGLPAGHYRAEITQLGFAPLTQEFDLTPQTPPLDLTANVATLDALQAADRAAQAAAQPQQQPPAPATSAENNQGAPEAPGGNPSPRRFGNRRGGPGGTGAAGRGPGSQSSASTSGASSDSGAPGTGAGPDGSSPDQTGGPGGYRRAQGGQGAQRGPGGAQGGPGGGQRGFQQLGLNGQQPADANLDATVGAAAAPDEGALGQAATADALLITGTVGRGADTAQLGPGGPGGDFQGGPGGPGGGVGGGAPGAPGFGGGAGGGAPGMNLRVGGGGAGGGGGRAFMVQGPGGRGRAGGPQGVAALWGMQRVLRQRANQIHFSLYEQYSNSALDARPYSLTAVNPAKIPTWNQRMGGNMGGPLRIPHIYNGADRTFFFINVDTGWTRNAVDEFSTVPTTFERQNLGNFCDRPNIQLYVPNPVNSALRTPVGCQLPASMINGAAASLLQFIPQPNLPGFVDNYHLQTRVPTQTTRVNTRVLHSISPKLNLRVIYNFSQGQSHSFQDFPSLESNSSTRGQSVTLGLTQNLSPKFVNDSQLIFSRNRVLTLNNFANQDDVAAALDISGVSNAPIDYGVPQLNFTNFTNVSDAIPSLVRNQTFRFVDGVTYTMTKHTFQTGVEIRRIENNSFSDPTPEGLFTFDGQVTSLLNPATGTPVSGTGFDFADFLLGNPSATNVRFGTPSKYFRNWGYIGYATDDWRVRPSFTLEYGIRYEAYTPPSELYGHISNLDFNPALNEVAVVVPGQVAPFSGSLPPALVRGRYNNWSPRIGFAWRPPIKTASGLFATTVRGGYGVFYNPSVYNQLESELANQPPWANSQIRITSPAQFLTLQNGFPPTSVTSNVLTNTYAVNPDYRIGYAQIWNLSTETTLPKNTTLVLTYTGTKGSHLDLLFAPNRSSTVATETNQIANAGNFIYDTSGANSIYHALQARIQHRLTRGLMLNAIYTYGKSIDNASTIGGGSAVVVQNPANLQAEYGLSSFDVRHQLRANYLYELPFGDRHRYAQKGLSAALFADWRLSGNITAQTGTPYTAQILGTSSGNTGSFGVFATRADQICNPNLPASQRSPLHFFNTSCFVVPAPGDFGDAARNTITGPGLFTWNMQMAKTFPFGKDGMRRLDVRWEITNLFNNPNLTGLSTVVNSLTYGRVVGASAMRAMDVNIRMNF